MYYQPDIQISNSNASSEADIRSCGTFFQHRSSKFRKLSVHVEQSGLCGKVVLFIASSASNVSKSL